MLARPVRPLDRKAMMWVSAAIAITLLPMLPELAPEIAAFAVLPLLWHAWRLHQGSFQPPPRLVQFAFVGVALATTLLRFGSIFGKQAGVALLAMLVGLKLLESRNRRDAHITLQLCFFIQLGYFLIQQNGLTAAFALGACAVSITALLFVERPSTQLAPALRTSAGLIVTAIPLTAVLFLLFPRIDTPLWGMPKDSHSASTGLSDSMRPGSIAELSQSSAIAFRVEFQGPPPAPPLRYFRGPVLTEFNGQEWRPASPQRPPRVDSPSGPVTDYVITLEPHQQRWLLALDRAVAGPDQTLDADYVLLARDPIRARVRVPLKSVVGETVGNALRESERMRALALPPDLNPRTRAEGRRIRDTYPSHNDRVIAATRFFLDARLAYTLSPPPLGLNTADEFLFETQRGFCEHFASAYVILMRAAGIPARVVTGYQGGEINPVDQTLVVRQSDAHAWAEIWMDGRGWVRQDPTAIAAPRRIADGLNAALPDEEPVPFLTRADAAWLRTLRDRAEAVTHAWNVWVLGYNKQRQESLLKSLGFKEPDWMTLGALLCACGALWQGSVMLALLRRHRRIPATDRAWNTLLAWLQRRGYSRAPAEGPQAFAARIAGSKPEWAAGLEALALQYARLKYGPPAPPDATGAFETAIKAWKKQHAGPPRRSPPSPSA